jgi:hypothetical protein
MMIHLDYDKAAIFEKIALILYIQWQKAFKRVLKVIKSLARDSINALLMDLEWYCGHAEKKDQAMKSDRNITKISVFFWISLEKKKARKLINIFIFHSHD